MMWPSKCAQRVNAKWGGGGTARETLHGKRRLVMQSRNLPGVGTNRRTRELYYLSSIFDAN